MNNQELVKRMLAEYLGMVEIAKNKNADYSKDGDAFANFKACQMLGIDPKIGFLVRMTDKLMRVSNLITKEAQVKDESIYDTLRDLANYSILLKLYIEYEKK